MTMKKNGGSDRRPYDIRRVSLMQPNKALSQDALDRLSLYEEVNRQFAQEFPQTAWNLGQQSSLPWLLSPRSEHQEDMTTASADNATSTGTSAAHMPAHDFEFITPADYSYSASYDDDGDFDVLSATTSPTTAPLTSPSDLSDMPDPFANFSTDFDPSEFSDMADPFATLSADFKPLWDLDKIDSLLSWSGNQAQGSYQCTQAMQNKGNGEANEQEQLEGSGLMVPPLLSERRAEHNTMLHPERESRGSENHVVAEKSCVNRKNMNQIMFNLNQLGSRLRDDARRQLDVMSNGCDASPLKFGEG
ncbi:hypothetical protein HDV63DRAFT_362105 [Trichoderma sp. SZMC 28014]